jgi:hypothetical protein
MRRSLSGVRASHEGRQSLDAAANRMPWLPSARVTGYRVRLKYYEPRWTVDRP